MILETERLIIRKFDLDMAEDVHLNSLDEDNRRFVPDEVFETVEDAKETLEYLISVYDANDKPQVYPVFTKQSNKNIGYVQFVPLDDKTWEVGYHIAKQYTNKGYCTEALKTFLPYMANKYGVNEVYGICLKENVASVAVMRKCGFETLYTGIGNYQGEDKEIIKNILKF